jgi:PAS domain S-box-containing protein
MKLLSLLGAIASFVIAIAIPSVYCVISINETIKTHEVEAAYLAKIVENIVQARPDLWEYESLRLKEVISKPSIRGERDEREILTATGKLLAKNDFTEKRPIISVSAPFFDSGRLAGSVIVRGSLRRGVITTALLGTFSLMLGGLIFFVFSNYPLRKLESTLMDLRMEKEKSEKTLYAIGDGVITVDHRGKIRFINRAAAAHVGMEISEAVGRQLEDVYVVRRSQESRIGDVAEEGDILIGKGGNEYPVEEVRTDLTEMEDAAGGVVIVFRDISERKKAEEERKALEQQFHQAQKLESLGVLAGGIAHDFNNILAVIMCYSSLAKQMPEKAAEFMPEIEKAAERAAELCRKMLAYAGQTQFVQSQVDMTALVDDMLGMLKSTLPQNVDIKPYLTGDIPSIEGDAGQLRQIVMNLIINASEAIGEEQGDIRIVLAKTRIVSGETEKDYMDRAITAGSYLCLEVTDSGCGMDDETKQRIFEPFYTTKFVGRGLGMPAVLGIITSHGGALQFTSQPGRGSAFRVYLPVKESEPSDETPKNDESETWRGGGTILLAEDEEQIQQIAKELLEALGFKVIAASNGSEALQLYRNNAEEIRLVVTDMGMPLMDGYQLLRELKKINPALPIIISSGFGDVDITSRIAEGTAAGFLSKPYRFDQLQKVLRGVVEKSVPVST